MEDSLMKVNQDIRVLNDRLINDIKVQQQVNSKFQNVIKSQTEKLQMGELQNLFSDIEKAGERLAKSRNFRDLAKYKLLVKKFLKEVSKNGIGLNKSHTMDIYGESRVLQTIEKIDEKFIELTGELLRNEEENINILSILGEIKGLIINLYS
jgi:uncharacterized protein